MLAFPIAAKDSVRETNPAKTDTGRARRVARCDDVKATTVACREMTGLHPHVGGDRVQVAVLAVS